MAVTADAYPIDGARDALWMATAVQAPVTQALQESTHSDVAVIGAGFYSCVQKLLNHQYINPRV